MAELTIKLSLTFTCQFICSPPVLPVCASYALKADVVCICPEDFFDFVSSYCNLGLKIKSTQQIGEQHTYLLYKNVPTTTVIMKKNFMKEKQHLNTKNKEKN